MIKIEATTHLKFDESLERFLNKLDLPYIMTQTFKDGVELYKFTIICPNDFADEVVTYLSAQLKGHDKNLWVIKSKLDSAVSEHLANLGEKREKPTKAVPKLIEDIVGQVEPYTKLSLDILAMISISALVAVIGLFLNQSAVIIGAMLLSPFLGPITAFSFYAAVGEHKKVLAASIQGAYLLFMCVGASAAATKFASYFLTLPISDEIVQRMYANPLDVFTGVLLGVAGGIALTTSIPGILVGVAIAAALVPPAAVTGIGLALADSQILIGSFLKLASNSIGLILGCMILLFVKGVSPRKYWQKNHARKYLIYTIASFIGLSMILTALNMFVR